MYYMQWEVVRDITYATTCSSFPLSFFLFHIILPLLGASDIRDIYILVHTGPCQTWGSFLLVCVCNQRHFYLIIYDIRYTTNTRIQEHIL